MMTDFVAALVNHVFAGLQAMLAKFVILHLCVFEDQRNNAFDMTTEAVTGLATHRADGLNVRPGILSGLSSTIGGGQLVQKHFDQL